MARDAAADHREYQRRKRAAAAKLEQLRAFCRDNGIDFEEIRTEANGHGPGETRTQAV